MTLPGLVITALRVIHIFGAVSWVGGGIFLVSVLLPTVREAGPDGGRFMLQFARAGRYSRALTVSAILTVLAGALLFWPTSGYLSPQWFQTRQGVSLTLGAIAGIAALGDGIFRAGRIASQMSALGQQILEHQGPPPPELMQKAQALGAKLSSAAMMSVAIGAVALFFMAAAQP